MGVAMASKKSMADFFWFLTDPLRVCLVEAKACGEKRIEFARLQPHQRDALLDFKRLDKHTFGYVAVNIYDSENIRKVNRLFMVPVDVWVSLEEVGDRKSIPLKTLEEHEEIIECPRDVGSKWDMESFVKGLSR